MFASRTNWRLDPNRFTLALEEYRRSGRDLYDLTVSNPTVCGIAYPTQQIMEALGDPRGLEYHAESKGLRTAREAIASYYAPRKGFSFGSDAASAAAIDPEHIVLTSGTSEAYSHIIRLLCEPGDDILVPAPSYPLFEFLADIGDIRLVPYSLAYDHGWQIDFESLRAGLTSRSRAVLVVHPNNPTGSFVKAAEASLLAEICASHNLALIADEVFLDYTARPELARTFAFQENPLTFTLSGLSKVCLLPQMKLAWMVVGGTPHLAEAASARLELIADTYLSVGTPVQLALPTLLGLRENLQSQLQERISNNLAALDSIFRGSNPVTRLDREGGWYAVIRVPATRSDEELSVDLLKRTSVLVHPGHFFNFPKDGFLILSLIAPLDLFQEGVRGLAKFFIG